ncbi:hypothetical protein [Nodularia chucula]|uniref:hypothetical protein n=1 Tax=Nodularia chucula TaxID=3093667 RepID=UPI0039C5FFCA
MINQNVTLSPACQNLSPKQLKSKVNTIAATLERRGFKFSRTVITAEVMEIYPLARDWEVCPKDCKADIIRALLRKRS